MQRHIEKKHGGVNDQTVHLDENHAKYVFPPEEGAKRLDVHPQAWPKFATADRVFFVIEGCLKADAILSAGEAVFSVPSVTLWRAPELPAFTKMLRRRVVYVVPDNDIFNIEAKGHTAVTNQAMFCRTFLRNLGIDAHVAASTLESGQKGIDDFLGHGGTMDDLAVLERETRFGLAEWLAENQKWRKDRVVRGAELLNALALYADMNGKVWASLRTIARVMGVHPSRVQRAIKDLEECGVATVDGSLETAPRYFNRAAKRHVGWDWKERPTITIVPELRAKDTTRRLGG